MTPSARRAAKIQSWQTAVDQLRAAVQALLHGDSIHYKSLWSHHQDVTMMGAYGGLASGWNQVSETIDRAAARYRGWEPNYHEELIAKHATADLAYLVLKEKVQNGDDRNSIRARRITLLYRMEDSNWRIFHHHSDPLSASIHGSD